MSLNQPVDQIAIVGTGVIGASWAAYYLARGSEGGRRSFGRAACTREELSSQRVAEAACGCEHMSGGNQPRRSAT
jgi:glycine/D-amino acid oxidase-like deaminating enzyme